MIHFFKKVATNQFSQQLNSKNTFLFFTSRTSPDAAERRKVPGADLEQRQVGRRGPDRGSAPRAPPVRRGLRPPDVLAPPDDGQRGPDGVRRRGRKQGVGAGDNCQAAVYGHPMGQVSAHVPDSYQD